MSGSIIIAPENHLVSGKSGSPCCLPKPLKCLGGVSMPKRPEGSASRPQRGDTMEGSGVPLGAQHLEYAAGARHGTLLKFQLEDAGLETPLDSDASQLLLGLGLEPRETWVGARPGLSVGFAPLKAGLGSLAWEPGSLRWLAGRAGSCKGAQAAAPVRPFLFPPPQA